MKLAVQIPNLGRIFGRTKTGLAVYLTDKVLRVLEIDNSRKPTIQPIEVFWEHQGEEERRRTLENVVEANRLKGKEVVSCINAGEGILRFHRYPAAMSKKDLSDAISWQIKSGTQQIKEETVFDYYFLERDPDDRYVKVVITIASRNAVDKLANLLSSVGLKPKIIDYEVVAIINYGLSINLPSPFSILYVDYHESMLVYHSKNSISYSKIDFIYGQYKNTGDTTLLDSFLIEVRNQLVINEISNIYVAGPVISDEQTLDTVMTNLPVLGILDLEEVPPSFLIPYALAIRGLEEV